MQTYTINNPISATFVPNGVMFVRDPSKTTDRILDAVSSKEGGRKSTSDLARLLGYSKSHVSYYLHKLMRAGRIDQFSGDGKWMLTLREVFSRQPELF